MADAPHRPQPTFATKSVKSGLASRSAMKRWPSLASLDRLIDFAPAFNPILEGAEIVDLIIAHVFEHFAAQARAPARRAVKDDGLVLGEIFIMVRRLWIGAEFQHAARNV